MTIVVQLFDQDARADQSYNPELALMLAEGDDEECDIEESMWLAGTHVTHTHLKESS